MRVRTLCNVRFTSEKVFSFKLVLQERKCSDETENRVEKFKKLAHGNENKKCENLLLLLGLKMKCRAEAENEVQGSVRDRPLFCAGFETNDVYIQRVKSCVPSAFGRIHLADGVHKVGVRRDT